MKSKHFFIGVIIVLIIVYFFRKPIKKKAMQAGESVKKFVVSKTVYEPFYNKFSEMAKQAEKITKVPYLVTLAQAALESGWGKSAPHFNFFGHKKGSEDVPYYESKTWEFGNTGDAQKDRIFDRIIKIYGPGEKVDEPSSRFNGKVMSEKKYAYRVFGKFRKYNNAQEAFISHGEFLRKNKRYEKAFLKSTPEDFAIEIAKAGYATDPNYAQKLLSLISLFKNL